MTEEIFPLLAEGEVEEFRDAYYAEELQLQEALEASLQISSNAKDDGAGPSCLFSCGICWVDKEPNKMFKIAACTHTFCSECITKHIEAQIDENINPISCPDPKCPAPLELDSSMNNLPQRLIASEIAHLLFIFDRWGKHLCEQSVDASQRICSELFVYENKEEVITDAECTYCGLLFCAQCRVSWHSGQDCKEYQRIREDDLKVVEEMAKNLKWMKCRNCNSLVDKTFGCIHMTCRCGFEFCYVCGSTWSEDHWATSQDCQAEDDE